MRKKLLFLVLLLSFFISISLTQDTKQKEIENLESKLKTSSGMEKIKILNQLAKSYWYVNPKRSVEMAKAALNLLGNRGDKRLKSDILKSIGVAYYFVADYETALNYYSNSLSLAEEINDEDLIASCMNNIAVIYEESNKYDKALDYYHKALFLARKMDHKDKIATYLSNIGIVYFNWHFYNKALEYFLQALEIGNEIKSRLVIAMCQINISNVYNKIGEFEKAIEFSLKSLKVSEEIEDVTGICASLSNLGLNYTSLGKLDQALGYLQRAEKIASENLLRQYLKENYEYFSNLFIAKLDYKKALEYYKKFVAVKEEIFTQESEKKIADMQVKYDTEQKEKENELLRQKSRGQQILIISLSVIFVFILILLILIYNRYRLKWRLNLALEKKNEQLNLSIQKLNELNLTKDKFFSIIAHDLRNPLNSLLEVSQLLTDDLSLINEEKLHSFHRHIHSSSKHLYNLLENLLLWAHSQTGKMSFSLESFELKCAIDEILSLFEESAKNKQINLQSRVRNDCVVLGDRNMIETILRNLVSNGLKFTQKGGEVFIDTQIRDSYVEVRVNDTGIGIDRKNQNKLFRIDGDFSMNGTRGEKGTGLGLIICKEFIEQIGGEIFVKSQLGCGSTFAFTIPRG